MCRVIEVGWGWKGLLEVSRALFYFLSSAGSGRSRRVRFSCFIYISTE
jgi:hypothetical protein